MEFLNTIDSTYEQMLKRGTSRIVVKVELLSYYETPLQSLTGDVLLDVAGSLSANLNQLTRRSCSISFYNATNKYKIDSQNPFWMGNKFKLYIGIADNNNTYLFEQGVFLATDIQCENNIFSLNGVDKGAVIDGSLGLNSLETQYIIESSNVFDIVNETLSLNMNPIGAMATVVDTVTPMVDFDYKSVEIESQISVDSNSPLGDLILSLAEGYGADVFYDVSGRLNFKKALTQNGNSKYSLYPVEWRFSDSENNYSNLSISYSYDAKNAVTVYTNSSELPNVTYTAFINNPSSPISIDLIGTRRMEAVEMPYVADDEEQMIQRCKEYGEYLLTQETFKGATANLNCPLIPHLDVDMAISITNRRMQLADKKYIISEVTMPLDGSDMSVSATQVDFLTVERG